MGGQESKRINIFDMRNCTEEGKIIDRRYGTINIYTEK